MAKRGACMCNQLGKFLRGRPAVLAQCDGSCRGKALLARIKHAFAMDSRAGAEDKDLASSLSSRAARRERVSDAIKKSAFMRGGMGTGSK